MNKPKELTGVAKSYIDWKTDEISRIVSSNREFIEYCKEYIEKDLTVYKFLIQPFTPDLLQLFEGWGMFQETEKWKYYQPAEETNIMVSAYENKDLYFVVCEDEQAGSIKLNVLNDFITLCNLAGVNLKWREE